MLFLVVILENHVGATNENRDEIWRPLVTRHFPAHEMDNALKIIWYESRGVPDLHGDRSRAMQLKTDYCGSFGLFQINGGNLYGRQHAAIANDPHTGQYPLRGDRCRSTTTELKKLLFDPEENARIARLIWNTDGWGAWSTSHRLRQGE